MSIVKAAEALKKPGAQGVQSGKTKPGSHMFYSINQTAKSQPMRYIIRGMVYWYVVLMVCMGMTR